MRFDLGKISLEYDDDFQFFLFYATKYAVLGLHLNNTLEKSERWWNGKEYNPSQIYAYYEDVLEETLMTKVLPVVIGDLVDNGIYNYDEQRFFDKFKDFLSVRNTFRYQAFLDAYIPFMQNVFEAEGKKAQERNARKGKKGILQSLGDNLTDAVDQATYDRARKELGNAEVTKDLMSAGVINLVANSVFDCFCCVIEEYTERNADVVLGRVDMRAYFNNLGRIRGEEKYRVLKNILENQPRDPEYLMYLIQEGNSIGLDKEASYNYCRTVHPMCYYSMMRGATDQMLIKLDEELPQLKRESAEVRVTRSTELLDNLKSLVHYTDLYNIDSAGKYHFDSESDGIQELIGFESEAFLIYMAALEWIKSTAVNGYDLRSIGDYTYDYLNTLREEWKRIFKTYSLDSIKEVNRFTPYKNFIADGKKINDRMTAILRANAKAEKAKAAQNKALQANVEKTVKNTLPAPVQSTVTQKDPGIPLSIQDANTQQAGAASASKQNSSAGKNKLPIIGIGVVAIIALIAFGAKGLKKDSYNPVSSGNSEQTAAITATENHVNSKQELYKENTTVAAKEKSVESNTKGVAESGIYGIYSTEYLKSEVYAIVGPEDDTDNDYIYIVHTYYAENDPDETGYYQLYTDDNENWYGVETKCHVSIDEDGLLVFEIPGENYTLEKVPEGSDEFQSISHYLLYSINEETDSNMDNSYDLTYVCGGGEEEVDYYIDTLEATKDDSWQGGPLAESFGDYVSYSNKDNLVIFVNDIGIFAVDCSSDKYSFGGVKVGDVYDEQIISSKLSKYGYEYVYEKDNGNGEIDVYYGVLEGNSYARHVCLDTQNKKIRRILSEEDSYRKQ